MSKDGSYSVATHIGCVTRNQKVLSYDHAICQFGDNESFHVNLRAQRKTALNYLSPSHFPIYIFEFIVHLLNHII